MEAGRLENVTLTAGDLADIPIGSDDVDLALSVLVLHHVEEPRGALREIGRVVRGGGMCLIVEQHPHDSDSFQERMHDLRRGISPDELCEAMEDAGFEVVSRNELVTVIRADDAPALHAVAARKRMN